MKVLSSFFPEVKIIKGRRFSDERGFFCESFRQSVFDQFPAFVQENHSRSKWGTFRGMHYQLEPKAQGKLVYCVSGVIRDFVADIRKGSPTFGLCAEYRLDGDKLDEYTMLYVPPGFAHGFFVPEVEGAHVIYKVTDYYSPNHERSIRYNDPKLKLGLDNEHIRISDKDKNAPLLKDAEYNFVYEGGE